MQRKKIVIILGRFRTGTSEEGIQSGFRSAGWAVHAIDTRQATGAPGSGVAAKLSYRAHEFFAEKQLLKEFIDTYRALKPDAILMMKRTDLPVSVLDEVRSNGTKVALFYPDVHFNHATVDESRFHHIDLLITTKTYQLDYLRKNYPGTAIKYVPHGYVSTAHTALYSDISSNDCNRDLLYAGNHSTYKAQFLDKVIELAPKATFMLTGPNWNGKISDRLKPHLDMVQRRNVLYADMMQTSRINISIFAGKLVHGWEDLVSTRTFEIPAARGFMLHTDNDEIRTFFEPGKEIDVFSTPEECADKIRFYLENPSVRCKMIERAYNRAVPHYSYESRTIDIIKHINDL